MNKKVNEYLALLPKWHYVQQFGTNEEIGAMLRVLDALWSDFSDEDINYIENIPLYNITYVTGKIYSQNELGQNLINFYTNNMPSLENIKVSDILKYTHNQLEECHEWVQWAFPLTEPSSVNINAPLLTDEIINSLSKDLNFQNSFKLVAEKFWDFLHDSNEDWNPIWLTPYNHNFLRITRVIKSCLLLKQFELAERFFSYARDMYEKNPEIIGETTLNFWIEAYNPELSKWTK